MADHDCNQVTAEGGRTWFAPCGDSGVCSPLDVAAWNDAASMWVDALEREAKTADQIEAAADMRRRYTGLDTEVPTPWSLGERVRDYLLISTQASCVLVPIWQKRFEDVTPKIEDNGEEDEDEEEEEGWFEWLPTLPGLPSFPGMPSLPSFPGFPSFAWPTIPPWAFWVAGGVLVLYLWPRGKR